MQCREDSSNKRVELLQATLWRWWGPPSSNLTSPSITASGNAGLVPACSPRPWRISTAAKLNADPDPRDVKIEVSPARLKYLSICIQPHGGQQYRVHGGCMSAHKCVS